MSYVSTSSVVCLPSAATCDGERGRLVVVQQGEGVGGGAGGRHGVAPAGLQIGGGREAGQVGRAGGGDRGLLVRAPRTHLDQRPAPGRGDHPGGRGGDRAVVVEHRQDERLQHHALGERARDGQDRGAGEEELALGVPVDVAGEPVVGQPRGGVVVDDAGLA